MLIIRHIPSTSCWLAKSRETLEMIECSLFGRIAVKILPGIKRGKTCLLCNFHIEYGVGSGHMHEREMTGDRMS